MLLGDVGANFGFEQVSVSKMSEGLTGPSNICFFTCENGGSTVDMFPSGILLGMGSILMGSSWMRPWVLKTRAGFWFIASNDARCSKCSKLVLDVPRHRWY